MKPKSNSGEGEHESGHVRLLLHGTRDFVRMDRFVDLTAAITSEMAKDTDAVKLCLDDGKLWLFVHAEAVDWFSNRYAFKDE
jgi:hypothetical protein